MIEQNLSISIDLESDSALRQLDALDAALDQLERRSRPTRPATTTAESASSAGFTTGEGAEDQEPPVVDELRQIKAEIRLLGQLLRDLSTQLQPLGDFFATE